MTPQFRKQSFIAVAVLFVLVSAACALDAPQYTTIRPVANMYAGPTTDKDVVSQAIYGSSVITLEEQGEWVRVRTPEDQYEGWMPRSALVALAGNPPYASVGQVGEVRALMGHIYREPDVTAHEPLLTVPFETRLEIVPANGKKSTRWLQVRLVDGRFGWIQQGDIVVRSAAEKQKPLTVAEMAELAKRFMGLPYTWGGRSSFGYDCSGFVQMLMRQRGYFIPRDADVQAAWDGFVPVNAKALKAGDALFFGSKGKITHTGMYIGNDLFIHATTHDHPVIQISHLSDAYWTKLLVAQRRVK